MGPSGFQFDLLWNEWKINQNYMATKQKSNLLIIGVIADKEDRVKSCSQ